MKHIPIGIDSYSLHPLGLFPLQILEWAKAHGAEGVQFSGFTREDERHIDTAVLDDLAHFAAENGLYIEWGGGQHIPFDTGTWERKEILAINRRAAEQASRLGVRVVRSCSGGLMRWRKESPMTETLLEETARSLRSQLSMLRDNNVILAIETHFEFTTHELLRVFERCGVEPGDCLGICLDTMNLLTMLEDPVRATCRILPWVVSTHIKDGGVLLQEEGLVTFPAEIGKGVIALEEICRLLSLLPDDIRLTIEDHGGAFELPVFDPMFLSKFPDLSASEFAGIIRLAVKTGEAVRAGSLAVTPREEWGRLCERRLKRDIGTLDRLLRT